MRQSIEIVRGKMSRWTSPQTKAEFRTRRIEVFDGSRKIGYVDLHVVARRDGHVDRTITAFDAGDPLDGSQGEFGEFPTVKAAVDAVAACDLETRSWYEALVSREHRYAA